MATAILAFDVGSVARTHVSIHVNARSAALVASVNTHVRDKARAFAAARTTATSANQNNVLDSDDFQISAGVETLRLQRHIRKIVLHFLPFSQVRTAQAAGTSVGEG